MKGFIYAMIILWLLPMGVFSQSMKLQKKKQAIKSEQYRMLSGDGNETTSTLLQRIEDELNIPASDMKIRASRIDGKSIKHERYSQFHKGVNVYGADYVIHSRSGKLISANGTLLPEVDIEIDPQLSERSAIVAAKQEMGASIYKDEEQEVELVIMDKYFPRITGEYAAAYQVTLYSSEPLARKIYFIDAQNGAVLHEQEGLHYQSTPAIVKTGYYGEQEVITESTGRGDYILYDATRGDGILTVDVEGKVFRNVSTMWDLTNFDRDEAALDAHYVTSRLYDMMVEKFNYYGIDGEGERMETVISNGSQSYKNAFWDGKRVIIGGGDCHHGPLSTFEIIGHEYMHGVINRHSSLIYNNQSGGINESLADMFGKLLEYNYDPEGFNWIIGESIIISDYGQTIRDMAHPENKSSPREYSNSIAWEQENVHRISSIGNRWFYILSAGESGVTSEGVEYAVQPIGIETAGRIIWETQLNYLTSTSNYYDFYKTSLEVASNIFGSESNEYKAVNEAWKAVGVSDAINEPLDTDLSLNMLTRNAFACIKDDYYPITIAVQNDGFEDYTSGIANLRIFTDNDERDIAITDNIPVGEMVIITVDDLLFMEESGIYDITFELEYGDLNYSYHNGSTYIENYSTLPGQIEVSIESPAINGDPCSYKDKKYLIGVTNVSCETLSKGTFLRSTIYEGEQEIHTEEVFLEYDLHSGEKVVFPITLDISEEAEKIILVTNVNNEEELSATDEISISEVYLIEGTFYSNLSTDENRDKLFINTKSDSRFYNYQGDDYLYTTAYIGNRDIPCASSEDNFTYHRRKNSNVGIIEGCFDLSEIDNPKLSFDLVQFRLDDEDRAFPELAELYTFARVSWGHNFENTIDIPHQLEGKVVTHDYQLPPNYVGGIKIELQNDNGIFSLPDQSDLLQYDVQMVKDFRISQSVSTYDLDKKRNVLLFPNPTKEEITLSGDIDADNFHIYNTHGQIMQFGRFSKNEKIDIVNYPIGLYYIVFENKGVAFLSKSFIVMN